MDKEYTDTKGEYSIRERLTLGDRTISAAEIRAIGDKRGPLGTTVRGYLHFLVEFHQGRWSDAPEGERDFVYTPHDLRKSLRGDILS